MSKPDGGPAFPGAGAPDWLCGMSLRDYFAAQAVCGLGVWDALVNVEHGRKSAYASAVDRLAQDAYALADAMLAERSKS